jgi:hypothetical protein
LLRVSLPDFPSWLNFIVSNPTPSFSPFYEPISPFPPTCLSPAGYAPPYFQGLAQRKKFTKPYQ